ncbi:MAG: NUDIX domain-containing protein [Nocardioidaceae bacterium]
MSAGETLPGELWRTGDELCDRVESWPVAATARPYDGDFVSVRLDAVLGADGAKFERVVVEHQGAVGVLALDGQRRVLLLRQYRHAVGRRLLEIPAGVRDVAGEEPVAVAARELAEEAHLRAGDWRLLLELLPSPGVTDEHWWVFLARDLSVAVGGDHVAVHEEADMTAVWVPLEEAVRAVLDRRLTDSMAAAALLAVTVVEHRDGMDALPEVPLTDEIAAPPAG